MLTESTLEYTSGIASRLNEAGVKLEATAYSPLSMLVSDASPSIDSFMPGKLITSGEKFNYKDVIVKSSANNNDMSLHSSRVMQISDTIADAVKEHLSFARSVVAPAVTSYAKAIEERVSSFTYNDPTSDFEVNKVYIPEPLLNQSVLEDINIHRNKEVYVCKEGLNGSPLSEEEIYAKLFTGLKSVDEDIRKWLGTFDASLVTKVWNAYFCSAVPSSINLGSGYQDTLNSSLLLYFFSRKASTDIVQVSGMSNLTYDNIIKGIEQFAACHVLSSLKELDYSAKAERLILNSYKKCVTVYGPVYDKFMQEGGSIESILGQIVSGQGASTLEAIKASADNNSKAWNRYITLSNYNNKKNKAELLRSIYTSEYVNQLNDLDTREKEYHDKHPGFADLSYKQMKDKVEQMTEEQLEEVSTNALYIVGAIRFSYTNSYDILFDMEEAMKANPNLDPREAATIAVINQITDYVSSQIRRI